MKICHKAYSRWGGLWQGQVDLGYVSVHELVETLDHYFSEMCYCFILHNVVNVYKLSSFFKMPIHFWFKHPNRTKRQFPSEKRIATKDSNLQLRRRWYLFHRGPEVAPATEEWFLIRCFHLSTYLSPVGSVKQAYYTIPTPPFFVSAENYSFSVPE